MKKLLCIKREETEPVPQFLVDALVPLKPHWWRCEKIPHWADLNKAFNRIVGGVFFPADIDRAATLLETLANAAEAALQSTQATVDEISASHSAIGEARNAARKLKREVRTLVVSAETVDDVECARFHRREERA
jgi:hypothetical protein